MCPVYQVHFVDHGDNVYATEHVEHASDEEAIKTAHRMNIRSIGGGFEVWEGERLVVRHRN